MYWIVSVVFLGEIGFGLFLVCRHKNVFRRVKRIQIFGYCVQLWVEIIWVNIDSLRSRDMTSGATFVNR